MKRVDHISVEEATKGLKRQFISHPLMQSRVSFSPLLAAGAVELGWYRGHHAGVYDCYLTLKKAYPKAARKLLKAFSMDEDGGIG